MPRDYHSKERAKKTKARRDHALSRVEFRDLSHPREAAIGATSFSIKTVDADIRRMIDEAIARRMENGT